MVAKRVPDQKENVFRIYGMRRSGNHAIIDWLFRNAPDGSGLFLNNCRPGRDPLQTTRAPQLYVNGVAEPFDPGRHSTDVSFVEVSYEDAVPPAKLDPLLDTPETCIAIQRSVENWAASLLRKIQKNPDYTLVDRMRVMMKSLSLYRDMRMRAAAADIAVIQYDDWVGDEAYRLAMLKELALPGRDLSLGETQPFGGGSSFGSDGDRTTRAAQMAEDWEYQLIMSVAVRDGLVDIVQ